MRSPEDFYAGDHESIRPKLRAFVEFVLPFLNLSVAAPARMHQYRNGRSVILDEPPNPFGGSFTVGLSGDKRVRVGLGTVNGLVPRIYGARIDGLDDDGEPLSAGVPLLKLDVPGPGLRSYVALRVQLDLKTGAMDVENEEALQVVHLRALDKGSIAGGWPDDGEGVGYHPLVEVEWVNDERVKRMRRIVYFDRLHVFIHGEEGRMGRHFFSGVE